MQSLRTARPRTLAILAGVLVAMPFAPATPASAETAVPVAPSATITRLSPTSGLVNGGAVVTITGTNFTGASAVTFGSTPATRFEVVSAGTISAISPALAAGTHQISVTTAAGTSTAARFTVRTFEEEVLRLTNDARASKRKCGGTTYRAAKPLRWDATLARVAGAHSEDMAAKSYFSHNSTNGRTPFERMKAAGYRYDYAGENIAAGYRTPKSVVTAWLKSPGHCKNIMKRSFTELGVGYADGGYYGSYWTQDFGNPR